MKHTVDNYSMQTETKNVSCELVPILIKSKIALLCLKCVEGKEYLLNSWNVAYLFVAMITVFFNCLLCFVLLSLLW